MAHRIEIGFKSGIRDALGEKIKRRITDHLGFPVAAVRTVEVYTIEGAFSPEDLAAIAVGPLCDPIIQQYAVDCGIARTFDWLIEVGFRPGVTDNVGKTAREAIELLFGKSIDQQTPNQQTIGLIAVYTSRQYILSGPLSKEDAEKIAASLLANDLIERYDVIDGKTWDPARGLTPYVPKVGGVDHPQTVRINLNVDDQALVAISNEGVLALTLGEMKILQAYLNDEAVVAERRKVGLDGEMTDAELECLAQTWSEHCKHKIFNASSTMTTDGPDRRPIDSLFKTYIKGSTKAIREAMGADDWCLSVFVDNAGSHQVQRQL